MDILSRRDRFDHGGFGLAVYRFARGKSEKAFAFRDLSLHRGFVGGSDVFMVMDLPALFESNVEQAERGEEESAREWTDSLLSVSKKEIEKAIVSYISEKYAIPEENISAETVLDAQDPEAVEIREIQILIRGESSVSAETIRNDLHETFLGKSRVTVSFTE